MAYSLPNSSFHQQLIPSVTLLLSLLILAQTWFVQLDTHNQPQTANPSETLVQTRFKTAPGAISDEQWSKFVPKNGGFVPVNSSYFKVHGDGVRAPAGVEQVGVTMFHQLHCLQMLRDIVKMVSGSETSVLKGHMHHARSMNVSTGKNESGIDFAHHFHCLDYIAQSVLCYADGLLEGTNKDGNVAGNFAVHQCRDPQVLYTAVEGN